MLQTGVLDAKDTSASHRQKWLMRFGGLIVVPGLEVAGHGALK